MQLVQPMPTEQSQSSFNASYQETLEFGEWIRIRRLRKMINQEVLAEMVGVHQSVISRIENGRRTRLTKTQKSKLIEILSSE